jgi:hypothetical protein
MAGAVKGEAVGNELNKALGPFGGALPDIERAPEGRYGKKKAKGRGDGGLSQEARGNTRRRQTMPDTPPHCPPPSLFNILSIACYMEGDWAIWSADGSEVDVNVNRA